MDTVSNSIPIRTERNFLLSPITIASLTNGDTLILFSISDGETFFPPLVIIISLFLSTILTKSPS